MMYILSSYIYLNIMVILIEITVENRLKWIVILLRAISRNDFYVSVFCAVTQCSPFLLSQCSWCLPHASLQCYRCMNLPASIQCCWCTPYASLQCSWYMPPKSFQCGLPFNALEDVLPPPPASHLQSSWCMPPASLPLWFWNLSEYLLQIPFPFDPILFYLFWFPNHNNNEKELLAC